ELLEGLVDFPGVGQLLGPEQAELGLLGVVPRDGECGREQQCECGGGAGSHVVPPEVAKASVSRTPPASNRPAAPPTRAGAVPFRRPRQPRGERINCLPSSRWRTISSEALAPSPPITAVAIAACSW